MKIRIIAGLIAGLAISSNASAAQVFFQDFEGLTPNAPFITPLPALRCPVRLTSSAPGIHMAFQFPAMSSISTVLPARER